jgi:hypothetical protein
LFAFNAALRVLVGISVVQSGAAYANPDDQTIVVQGRTLRSQVQSFVQKLTPNAGYDQLGRFVQDVCPAVVGLPENWADDIVARIRRVAGAVGANVAKQNCSPNLVLLVAHDKRTAIGQLRNGALGVFRDLPSADIRKLMETPGPTAAWQISSRLGADGMPLTMVRVNPTDGPNDAVPLVRGSFLSRTNMQIIRQFDMSLVIVEAQALDQVDTRQLADYVVMRGLAGTGTVAVDLPASSILQLFSPGVTPVQAPESVTWWDVAFLKSLYASSNSVSADQQRGAIAQRMKGELNKVHVEKR